MGLFFLGQNRGPSLWRPAIVGANEGSVSPVGSAEGKRPEFVNAKRAASPFQGRAATIERTEHRFESGNFGGGLLMRNKRSVWWTVAPIEHAEHRFEQ